MTPLRFEVLHQAADCSARVGRAWTPHGYFDTPAFMPVGTQATIKGLWPAQIAGIGAQVVLANSYHLLLRPGPELVARMGGLHQWMRWPPGIPPAPGIPPGIPPGSSPEAHTLKVWASPDSPPQTSPENQSGGCILTDSGGFQVYSLADISRIDDDGVVFRSHLDGATIHLNPQRSMQVQNALGADIIMAFDDCPPAGGQMQGKKARGLAGDRRSPGPVAQTPDPTPDAPDPQRFRLACERTIRWLDQCAKSHQRKSDQALFGIVQGGTDLELRQWCAQAVLQHDLPGYAIGGVAVGEGFDQIKRVVQFTTGLLPAHKPRYLMGVGLERDILVAVRAGVDMFDCVLPTRNGRNASALTSHGPIRLRNAKFADDPLPIQEGCDCPACGGGFSRSYIRHLFQADEMMGPILVSLHNLRHLQRYLLDIRKAIRDNDWSLVARNWPLVQDILAG